VTLHGRHDCTHCPAPIEWATDVFITNYLPLILFPVLYIGARLWYKQGPISPQDMDFVTGLDAIEADT
jgi:yeast amino acid transporter